MKPKFSLVINHTPWRPERVQAKAQMLLQLLPLARGVPFFLHDADYRAMHWQDEGKVAWARVQWIWSLMRADCTHHVFMTDDLHIAPRFWDVLEAMVEACPDHPIGLLSNHPRAVELTAQGFGWYRTNSWIVGPAYVLPHAFLADFFEWFEKLPDGPHTVKGTKAWANDDSTLNEFVTRSGSWSAHPLPTIIEHRADLESTVGHGDEFSRERVSWRAFRAATKDADGRIKWTSKDHAVDVEAMTKLDFWRTKGGIAEAPLLAVGG